MTDRSKVVMLPGGGACCSMQPYPALVTVECCGIGWHLWQRLDPNQLLCTRCGLVRGISHER